jgi:hypothetical protein
MLRYYSYLYRLLSISVPKSGSIQVTQETFTSVLATWYICSEKAIVRAIEPIRALQKSLRAAAGGSQEGEKRFSGDTPIPFR